MRKRVFILILVLLSLFAANSWAQRSTQATMRVSVEVVSGTSVEIIQPDVVTLSQEKRSNLGMLTIKGTEKRNVHITNTSNVTIRNKDGDEVKMEVLSQRERKDNDSESIRYEGLAKADMQNSNYQGELATTIEYF